MSQTTGIFASIKTLGGTLLGVVQTRLALLGNELEEARLSIIKLLVFSFMMIFFFFLAITLLTLLIVSTFWDTYRLLAIGLTAAIYLCIAAGFAIYVVRTVKRKSRSKLFSASLAELNKDRIALGVEE